MVMVRVRVRVRVRVSVREKLKSKEVENVLDAWASGVQGVYLGRNKVWTLTLTLIPTQILNLIL
jgi:hypothetical protein